MIDYREYDDPTTAPDHHNAIEAHERYVPALLAIAAVILVAAGLFFAFVPG